MSAYKNIDYLKYYLLASYLVFAPFLIIPDLGMYDSKRILQLFLFLFLSFSFLISFSKSFMSQENFIRLSKITAYLLCLFFCLGSISAFYSEFTQFAFVEIFLFAIIILCSILLSESSLSRHYYLGKFVNITAIIFASVYVIYFLGNYIAAQINPLVPIWPDRISVSVRIDDIIYKGTEVLNFVHKRFLNHIQTWTLPLIVSAALFFRNNKTYRKLILGLLTFWWLLVFASGARGTLVAFIIACVILFILFRKRSYRFFAIAVSTAFGGFFLYFLMFKVFVPSESLPVARMTDSGRWEMWAKAMEMWFANPLLGAGPMHYAVIEGEPYFGHPHNFYLQLLAEWGVVALIAFLALPVFYFLFIKKRFLKNNFEFKEMSPRNSAVYMGFFGSAIAGFAHAGVSGVLHTPMSQIWAIIVVAWLVSLWNRKSDHKKTLYLNRKHVTIAFSLFVIGLYFLVSPDTKRVYNNHKLYKEQFSKSKLYPRFWEQGLIYERNNGVQEKGGKETGTKTQDQNQDGRD